MKCAYRWFICSLLWSDWRWRNRMYSAYRTVPAMKKKATKYWIFDQYNTQIPEESNRMRIENVWDWIAMGCAKNHSDTITKCLPLSHALCGSISFFLANESVIDIRSTDVAVIVVSNADGLTYIAYSLNAWLKYFFRQRWYRLYHTMCSVLKILCTA